MDTTPGWNRFGIRNIQCSKVGSSFLYDTNLAYIMPDTIYLDHAGTAIPPRSLIERFASDMTSNLFGNTHSTSVAAQNTSKRIESIRLRLLQRFNADAEEVDLVFVAN